MQGTDSRFLGLCDCLSVQSRCIPSAANLKAVAVCSDDLQPSGLPRLRGLR